MVKDPLSVLDALMVALSGFVIVFLMLAALWAIIIVVSRVVGGLSSKKAPAAAPAPVPAAAPAPAPAVPAVPQVELVGIEETQAACVMAIVSHETGIPLDQLVFKSIKAK
ncbi:MAG: OadG family transporter subunit [Agathobaculum sp.]|jgi:Na+-transporting methylmalonyl-CoA/oxaloacetate decarboxylase gamma subunit|uniref:OadG family transporter subunit n=1 Tax=Agathobaculum sp. TaxID=2048138 RepID=UPI003D93217F